MTTKTKRRYNVTLNVFMTEYIYEIEANSKSEAFKIAKQKSDYGNGEAELSLFEIEELPND